MKPIDWSTYTPKELYRALQTMPQMLLPWRVIEGVAELPMVLFRSVVGDEGDAELQHFDDGWRLRLRDRVCEFGVLEDEVVKREADLVLQVWGYILLTEADLVLK